MRRHHAPTAEFQLAFLAKVERLLARGKFTSTYKFALLIALTNIAVERGSDTSDKLDIEVDELARQYIALYWSMARPYPRIGAILKQNREQSKPSRVITLLKNEVSQGRSSYQRLRVYRNERDRLVNATRRTLARDVLYRLQTLGARSEATATSEKFLYDHPPTAAECAKLTHLTLKPGIAACLRQLRGVIVAMVQARWALWVRENNKTLGADRNLESFLFGASRTSVARYSTRLYELQDSRCFYSGARLRGPTSGEVDHFIPWSRYPFDSPFNLVLASRQVNNEMRDDMKPLTQRDLWLARNASHFDQLIAPEPHGFGALEADAETARMISAWLYAKGA